MESLASIKHRAKTTVMGQFQAERKIDRKLMDLLNKMLSSIEEDIKTNRCFLESVESWSDGGDKLLAQQSLSDLLETNNRIRDSIRGFIVFLSEHMECKENDVVSIMGY
jgi:predicted secreted protein